VPTDPSGAGAAAGADLVLGQLANLSGPGAARQAAFNAGARLVLQAFNDRGGAQGRALRLVSLDHQQRPERAQAAARELLVDQRASLLFGCSGAAAHLALLPLQRQQQVAALAGREVDDALRLETGRWCYFIPAGQTRIAQALAQSLAELGLRRVAAVHPAGPAQGAWLRLLQDACVARQLHWVGSAAVSEDPGTAREALLKLTALSPQALLLALPGRQAVDLLAALDGLSARTQAPDCYALPMAEEDGRLAQVAAQPGARAAAAVRRLTLCQSLPSPWSTQQAALIEFRRQAEAARVPVGYPALEGWMAAQVLVQALKNCGRDTSPARLHAALDSLQIHLGGMTVDFSRREMSGSRLVERVRPSADGR
jgi:ABC-type branched-subunit amino acid transport system substrate-binding protein